MKKLIIALFVFGLLTSIPYISFAQTYIPITKDLEVLNKDMVQIKISTPMQKEEIITLSYINTQIAVIGSQIVELQKKLDNLQALKLKVEVEANKVILKKEEIIPIIP